MILFWTLMLFLASGLDSLIRDAREARATVRRALDWGVVG